MPISVNYAGSNGRAGKVIIDGLSKGAGLNLGNVLRRTLLSQLEGAAVTAVRIDGALHEFECVDGVKEDVTEIIENLRKLDLKLNSGDAKVVAISTNQREVKALDIQTDGSVEILNPDLHIATLNPGASLEMAIEVERGRGFRLARENLKLEHPDNTVPIASDFSPVKRVGYKIEEIDGQTEELVMQIETNGSITPVDVILQAIDLLTGWLQPNALVSHSDYNGDAGKFDLDETAFHKLGSALKRELLAYEVDGNRPVLAVELKDSSVNISTDGTLTPKAALASAASQLCEELAGLRAKMHSVDVCTPDSDTKIHSVDVRAPGPVVFGATAFADEAPDLLAIQLDSYNNFINERLPQALSEVFPITDFKGECVLELVAHRLGEPTRSMDECRLYSKTHSAPFWLSLRLSVKENGDTKEGEVCMGEIPLMTEQGTFIINGTERVVVSQLHRSPGAIFKEETHSSGRKLHIAQIIPYRGAWVEFESDVNDLIHARIDRRPKMHATILLRALGWGTNEEILSLFDGMTDEELEPIRKTLEDDPTQTQDDAFIEIFRRLKPDDPPDVEIAKNLVNKMFFDPARYDLSNTGRAMLNRQFGVDTPEDVRILRKEDIIETLKYLLKHITGEKKPDDIDHLANRRVRPVGELLQNQLRLGLMRMARVTKERLTIQEDATIQDIVNPEPLAGAIKDFFESSQLSQYMQQTNPLDALTHKRRLSALGPGGLRRDRATHEVRDVHHSHLDRICPIETPEGPSVGLIVSLTNHARVNEYGFLEAPYRKVENGENTDVVEYLTADKTEGRVTTEAHFSPARLIAQRNGELVKVDKSDIDYAAFYPQQMLGTSASLIPLIEHDDANRALMGANMQRQAVPLLYPEAPLVQTGMERKAAVDSRALQIAKGNGKVTKATSDEIVIALGDGTTDEHKLIKHRRANSGTRVNQRPIVSVGQSVRKGQIIADCSSSANGLLSLGRDVLVAYMPWEGYNFEDAIVISDRLVKDDVFTSVSIETFRVETRDTEHGVEYLTRDVPDNAWTSVPYKKFGELEENGIAKVGKWVKPGDMLVGKFTPKPEPGRSDNEAVKIRYEDSSQLVPPYVEGQVVRVTHLAKKNGDDVPVGVEEVAIVDVAAHREIKVGDKLAGRHGNKGVVANIVPEEDMPFLPDGTPIDMVLNPLGVPTRMNLGQILETHLGWAAAKLSQPVISPPYDGASPEDIENLLQKVGLPKNGMTTLLDGRDGRAFDMQTTVGYQYQMKLHHQVDDKIHARSVGPYSIITGQPLGGRSQMGGQRFGEMEVWALQAYGAAHTLHEMMTLKSISGHGVRTYESLAKGEEVHSTDYEGDTPSYNLLTNWLRGLCINMTRVSQAASLPNAEPKGEDGVQLRLASPEEIRDWSEGEVKELAVGIPPNPDAMGHIELAAPVSHVWFFKGIPSRIGLALDLSFREIERVIYYEAYIVLNSSSDELQVGQRLTTQEYEELKDKHEFRAEMGAGAIRELLERIDLDETISDIKALIEAAESKPKIRALKKRLELLQSLQRANIRPEWMILDVIPVIPANVRPNVPLQEGEYATIDLNTLYRRVINRNNRLKRLIELEAPETIIHNEKRELQEAVDALFDNGRHGRIVKDEKNARPLTSLSDLFKGKPGIFRSGLLGFRVDYSGRSVIVSGPELKLDECGLPVEMALTLFTPFIMRRMQMTKRAQTLKSAQRAIREGRTEAIETLQEVIADKLVLLNRAPTLHRAGVQAFKPVLVNDRAIHLHPLVCYGFNADFDGDQMAIHVPVTPEAQKEARELMLSPKNILSPATGRLLARPSMDLILGCHYLTLERKGVQQSAERIVVEEESTTISDAYCCNEIKRAYELGEVSLHAPIQLKLNDEVIETTVGRAMFNDILDGKLPFVNETLDAERVFELVETMYREHGEEEAVALLNRLNDIGFKFATRSGLSISLETLKTDFNASPFLQQAEEKMPSSNADPEQYMRDIEAVADICDRAKESLLESFKADSDGMNPLHLMHVSGARSKVGRVLPVISGMCGVVTRAAPASPRFVLIGSNRRDGFSQLEYFALTYGARKGLADTAIKVQSSGYLTRKLADVAANVVVTEEDCGTQKPRNVVNCETLYGVCSKCYGTDLSTGEPVKLGTPVGIIAATAIGKPALQLTMRTFVAPAFGKPGGTLPQLTELFEARRPKERALFEVDGESFQDAPDLLCAKGLKSLHKHLLEGMMDVYRSQGVEVDAKHFEVIIRQMLSHAEITDPGDTEFYSGQQPGREILTLENASVTESGGQPATFEPIVMGISKAALTTDSFLSAASFQQTTNILTKTAIRGKIDRLRGMKECLIAGKLIPVGTGFPGAEGYFLRVPYEEDSGQGPPSLDSLSDEAIAYLNKSTAEFELSFSVANVLKENDIKTVRELVTKTEADMLKYVGFGRKCLRELKKILEPMGLRFGMRLDA